MAKPDCQKCGLCCCAPAGQDSFCDLTKDETKRMRKLRLKIWRPSVFDQMTQAVAGLPAPPFAALRTKQLGKFTVCVALDGVVGEKVACSIYAERPSTCHTAVRPGDSVCRALRSDYRSFLS